MSRRKCLIVLAVHAVFGVLNIALAVRAVVANRPVWLFVLSATAAVCNVAGFVWSFRTYRKETHGSDRSTEANPSDPRTGEVTFTISNPGVSYADVAAALARAGRTIPGLAAGGVVPSPRSSTELERVESDMPILAHRIARLRFDGKPAFVSLNEGVRFGVDADAQCSHQRSRRRISYSFVYEDEPVPHGSAPSLRCQCGFYALPSDVEPWDQGSDYVTLMVELSGTVIEHEKGYRAQHQRVVECQIPPCPMCLRPADVVQVGEDGQMYRVACAAHVPPTLRPGDVTVSLEDVAALVGVPVTSAARGESR